jgi:hypothetical protein
LQVDFLMTRWRSIQQRFWGRSQWVLGIDADIMAANLSRSLDAFLELPQDVVVTVRVRKLAIVSVLGWGLSSKLHCDAPWLCAQTTTIARSRSR